jgi:hypothetical protein
MPIIAPATTAHTRPFARGAAPQWPATGQHEITGLVLQAAIEESIHSHLRSGQIGRCLPGSDKFNQQAIVKYIRIAVVRKMALPRARFSWRAIRTLPSAAACWRVWLRRTAIAWAIVTPEVNSSPSVNNVAYTAITQFACCTANQTVPAFHTAMISSAHTMTEQPVDMFPFCFYDANRALSRHACYLGGFSRRRNVLASAPRAVNRITGSRRYQRRPSAAVRSQRKE